MRGAEPATGPLGDAELDDLFAPFAAAQLIALAVSGGADSLALLVAADRWRRRRGGMPDILVLTVDHRLRRESAGEARTVASLARSRGMAARVLVRAGPRLRSDVEAAARRARYRLLVEAARKAGASHLLTAHHRDDLAEGFMLRLGRGAGVFGLAAMRPAIVAGGLVIARPLLTVARGRLAATTASAGLTPAVDAMNDDPRYARARVRALLPVLAAGGLDPGRLADAATRLAGAAEAIDAAAGDLVAAAIETDAFAVARLDPARLGAAPREIRLRALVRLLLAVGGDDYPPRFERLASLLAAIEDRAADRPFGGRFKRTLAATVIEFRAGRFLLYREIGRDGLPSVALKSGFVGVWDHRFAVTAGRGLPAGLTLAALGEDGRRLIGGGAGQAPAGAIAALPAVRRGKRILAVPALGYSDNRGRELPLSLRPVLAERLRTPQLFPDFSGVD